MAVPFLQTVLRRDLAAAREYYPPDARPETWSNIIPAEAFAGSPSDFSECLGAEPVTSDIPDSATSHSIVFRFPAECVQVPTLAPGPSEQKVQRFNGLGVHLKKVDSRWWVTGVGAFRAVG